MVVFIIVLQALLGLSFTLGKLCLHHGAPCFLIAARMLVGGIVLLGYHSVQQRKFVLPHKHMWRTCLPYALSGIFGFPILRAWGLQFISSAKAALFFSLFPLTTAFISFVILGERLSIAKTAGLLIGCFGTIPLLMGSSAATSFSFTFALPELALFVSVFFLSYGMLNMQQLVKHHGLTPTMVNGMSMCMGGALALSSSYLTEPLWIHGNATYLALLMILQIFVSNLFCANLQAFLLTRYSATVLSLTSFLAPLSTICYGALFLQESITWHLFLTLFMVLLGLLCYHFEELKQKQALVIRREGS